MLKRAGLIAALFVTSTLAQAEESGIDQVLARVGDQNITVGHLIAMRAQLPAQYEQLPAEAIYNGLLDQVVQQALFASSVRATPKHVELTLENERRTLLASLQAELETQDAATPEALQALYQERFVEAGTQMEFNASHLLVKTQDEAAAAKARVDAGEAFPEVAKEVSTGPTGPNGGSLGWFGEGQMVAPFEAAVKELTVGAVSEPVETQFGWHVIVLNDRRAKEIPSFDDVKAELTAQLEGQAVQARLAELEAQVEVTRTPFADVDTDVLTQYDLIGLEK